jgi:hypothetical protein
MRRALALFGLAAFTACSSVEPFEGCPPGTVSAGSACLVSCQGPSDCLASEVCDPAMGACRPITKDAGVSESDSGLPIREDASKPEEDAGFLDAGQPPGRDTGFRDALPPDAIGPSDVGPQPDGGFAIEVSPSPVDFGGVQEGCMSDPREVLIKNRGTGAVLASNAEVQGIREANVVMSGLPRTLQPGEQASVFLVYAPQDVGTDRGRLIIQHQPSMMPAEIELIGVGLPSMVVDVHRQVLDETDILLVVDDSCSMAAAQQILSQQISTLFAALDRNDYHIGVTTTDMDMTGPRGALVGMPQYVTPQVPNADQIIRQRVVVGTQGSAVEQGLAAAQAAVGPQGVNGNFLRPRASLVAIILSDENDQSPGEVSTFAAGFEAAKSSNLAAINAITGTAVVGCTLSQDPGHRYVDAARLTGGVTTDICASDWRAALTTFPPSAVERTRSFPLSQRPDPSTISVLIDSQPAAGWTYGSNDNTIQFVDANALPAYGARVEITYRRACN